MYGNISEITDISVLFTFLQILFNLQICFCAPMKGLVFYWHELPECTTKLLFFYVAEIISALYIYYYYHIPVLYLKSDRCFPNVLLLLRIILDLFQSYHSIEYISIFLYFPSFHCVCNVILIIFIRIASSIMLVSTSEMELLVNEF